MSARLGLTLGLLLAGSIATWWLAAVRGVLQANGDPALIATQALFALSVARPMVVSVVASRAAALDGYAAGVRAAVPVVIAAWPLVALAWLASADSLPRTVAIEAALAGQALLTPLAGHALRRGLRDRDRAASVATAIGIALACAVWLLAATWRPEFGG
jgi:hypothetical protein